MVDTSVLREPPELRGDAILLRPLDLAFLAQTWDTVRDPEIRRYTHTHAEFTRDGIERHLRELPHRADRADWAITGDEGRYLGEVVLQDLDEPNLTMAFRIALAGPHAFGHGYGTAATRLVLDFAFDVVGLHRVELDVVAYNARARRVYEKCGFVVEGIARSAIHWDSAWHDNLLMAVLDSDPRD